MFEKIKEEILNAKEIFVVAHKTPDGDSVGCALGVYHAIKNLGKRVFVACEDEIPQKFLYLPDCKEFKKKLSNACDLVILVDTGSIKKIGVTYENIKTIVIDHHKSNPMFGEYNYVESDYASCGEVVYEFLEKCDIKLNKPAAKSIYCSIVSDSRFFKTQRVNRKTFEIAQKLLDFGVEANEAAYHLTKEKSLSEIRVLGYALLNTILLLDASVSFVVIDKDILEKSGATIEHTSDIADMILSVKSAKVAVFAIYLKENLYKFSLRSKDNIDVARIASIYNGGGHTNASGFVVSGEIEEIKKRLLIEIDKEL